MNRFSYWILLVILLAAVVQAAWQHDRWTLAGMLVALVLLRALKDDLAVDPVGEPPEGERLYVTKRMVLDDDGGAIWAPAREWEEAA